MVAQEQIREWGRALRLDVLGKESVTRSSSNEVSSNSPATSTDGLHKKSPLSPGKSRNDNEWQAESAFVAKAAASTVVPHGPTVHSIALPDHMVVNYLFGSYLAKLYDYNPVTIKDELLREIQAGLLPDHCFASLLLFACRWDSNLLDIVSPAQRAHALHGLFSRTTTALMPALEVALAGYQSMVVQPQMSEANEQLAKLTYNSRESYLRTAVYCVMTLFHLMLMALAYPHPAGPLVAGQLSSETNITFESFRSIVSLILRIIKVSSILNPRLHARTPGFSGISNGSDYYLISLERVKRVLAGCVAQDNYFSAMYQTEPIISWEDVERMTGYLGEEEIAYARALFGQRSHTNNQISRVAEPSQPIPRALDAPTDPDPLPRPPMLTSNDVSLTAPIQTVSPPSTRLAPSLSVSLSHNMRLGQLASLVGRYRRFVSDKPYLSRRGKKHLEQQLSMFLSELGPPFPDGIVPLLESEKQNLASTRGIVYGTAAYLMLMYHAISATLNSPADSVLFSGDLDWDWALSEAFVKAQEHAISATQLLVPLVESPSTLPQMCLPFFQWCTVRTGLIHFYYLSSLLLNNSRNIVLEQSPENLWAIESTRTQLMIHDAALRKAQGGIGVGERRSWWFELWLATTGLTDPS